MKKSELFRKIDLAISTSELALRNEFIRTTLDPEMDDEILDETATRETVETVKTMMEWYIPYLTTAISAGITKLICDTFQNIEDDFDLQDFDSVDITTVE